MYKTQIPQHHPLSYIPEEDIAQRSEENIKATSQIYTRCTWVNTGPSYKKIETVTMKDESIFSGSVFKRDCNWLLCTYSNEEGQSATAFAPWLWEPWGGPKQNTTSSHHTFRPTR